MAASTGDFGSQLAPGLRVIWGLEYKQHQTQYDKVFNVVKSGRNYEDDQELFGTGLVPQMSEGGGVSYDTIGEGASIRYTHINYGLGAIITRNMYDDDLYGKINNITKMLAKSGMHSIEIIGANVLNRAFSNSYLGADGLELCSTLHTTALGGTYRNEPSVAADLDVTSYEQMLIDLATQPIDNRGLKLPVKAQKLIIPTALEWEAQKILKSSQTPGIANNDYNPAQGTMPGGYMTMDWLTDTAAWFVKTDVMNGLTWMWRRKPDFSQDNDFDSDNAKFKTTFRCVAGWTDPRGLYGSPGA